MLLYKKFNSAVVVLLFNIRGNVMKHLYLINTMLWLTLLNFSNVFAMEKNKSTIINQQKGKEKIKIKEIKNFNKATEISKKEAVKTPRPKEVISKTPRRMVNSLIEPAKEPNNTALLPQSLGARIVRTIGNNAGQATTGLISFYIAYFLGTNYIDTGDSFGDLATAGGIYGTSFVTLTNISKPCQALLVHLFTGSKNLFNSTSKSIFGAKQADAQNASSSTGTSGTSEETSSDDDEKQKSETDMSDVVSTKENESD